MCIVFKISTSSLNFRNKIYNVVYKQIYIEIVVNFNRKIVFFYFIYFIDREITKIHFHTMTLLYVKGIFQIFVVLENNEKITCQETKLKNKKKKTF